jgi:glycosyltransferase involved in cell wall biosynthesis
MPPKISLVIPVYNREDYLGDAIATILSQTYKDFELLIWDDGSCDSSVAIAREYASGDRRIRIIEGQHQGQTLALKAAITLTTGQYLGWVDSDDLLELTALEETAIILDCFPEVGMVYTDHQIIDENNQLIGYGSSCQIPYSKERLVTDFMTFHFRLIRRSVYEQVGGINRLFNRAQDYDLCLRLSEVTEIYHLKQSLYYYRSHPDTVSNQQRVEQILWAVEASEQALQRRGLAEEYELDLQILGQCSLRRKRSQSTSPMSTEAIKFLELVQGDE